MQSRVPKPVVSGFKGVYSKWTKTSIFPDMSENKTISNGHMKKPLTLVCVIIIPGGLKEYESNWSRPV
jgi:hypothetical protein